MRKIQGLVVSSIAFALGCGGPEEADETSADIAAAVSTNVSAFTIALRENAKSLCLSVEGRSSATPELKLQECAASARPTELKLQWQLVAPRTMQGLSVFDGALIDPQASERKSSRAIPAGYLKLAEIGASDRGDDKAPLWLTCPARASGEIDVGLSRTFDRTRACPVGLDVLSTADGRTLVAVRPVAKVGTPHGDVWGVTDRFIGRVGTSDRVGMSTSRFVFDDSSTLRKPIPVATGGGAAPAVAIAPGAEPFVLRRLRMTADDTKINCLVAKEEVAKFENCADSAPLPGETWWITDAIDGDRTSIIVRHRLTLQDGSGRYLVPFRTADGSTGWKLATSQESATLWVDAPNNPGIYGSALVLRALKGREIFMPAALTYVAGSDSPARWETGDSAGAILRFERLP